jgi:hypothetical protein
MSDNIPPAVPEPTPSASGPTVPAPESAPAGATPPPAQPTPYGAPATSSPYASAPAAKAPLLSIFSLVAGALGVLGGAIVFIPFIGSVMQLFLPAAAIVLGFLGKKKEPQASKGLWLTGIILGFVGILFAIIGFIAWGALFATADLSSIDQDFRY